MDDATVCGICGDASDPSPIVKCIQCRTPFHLRLRDDLPGRDCGDAIMGESMGIEMICNGCIDLQRAGADPGEDMLSMFAAMTEGRLELPNSAPPQRAQPAPRPQPSASTPPPPPVRPPAKPVDDDRPRRRFRRIDR